MMCDVFESLRGARIVKVDAARQVFLAWFGGTYINCFNADGREFSCFSHSSGYEKMSLSRIEKEMDRHINNPNEQEAYP